MMGDIDNLLHMLVLTLFLTLAVYALAVQIWVRAGNVLCNPVLIGMLVLMGYLKIFAIDYELYHDAAQFIDFWLRPVVVLLAVPLYRNWDRIYSQWLPVVLSQLAGSVMGIVVGVYFAEWLGTPCDAVLSLASKSVTNPIAIEIMASVGGIPAITVATVITAGLFGQMAGHKVLKGVLYMPSPVGMSLGMASHAMGIMASLGYGRRMAAYAGLGLTLNGVLTVVLVSILIPLLGVQRLGRLKIV